MDECIAVESPVSYEASSSESYESIALSEALPSHLDSVGHMRTPSSVGGIQVDLLCARGRIVKLESALAAHKQAVKRARIEDGDHVTSHVTLDTDEMERLHKVFYIIIPITCV